LYGASIPVSIDRGGGPPLAVSKSPRILPFGYLTGRLTMPDILSTTFSALADPTRRALLARLREGEASVTELAEPFLGQMTLPGVTKHLKVLERAGLITKGRAAQWRPCRLNAAPLRQAADWMDEYRTHMEASLDRLAEYLSPVTAAPTASPRPAPSEKAP
jgi:DNA-binding transcriptional ArsR family regulator